MPTYTINLANAMATNISYIKRIGDYDIIEVSDRKGAAKITDGMKVTWIKPAAFKKLEATGILPPAALRQLQDSEYTLDDAINKRSMAGGKKPYVLVKFIGVEAETDKAMLVTDFQNKSAWLPKSQMHEYGSGSKSLGIWVTQWWAEQNGFVWSRGKVKWV